MASSRPRSNAIGSRSAAGFRLDEVIAACDPTQLVDLGITFTSSASESNREETLAMPTPKPWYRPRYLGHHSLPVPIYETSAETYLGHHSSPSPSSEEASELVRVLESRAQEFPQQSNETSSDTARTESKQQLGNLMKVALKSRVSVDSLSRPPSPISIPPRAVLTYTDTPLIYQRKISVQADSPTVGRTLSVASRLKGSLHPTTVVASNILSWPSSVRARIYAEIMVPTSKIICLDRPSVWQAFYPEDHFSWAEDVIEPIRGVLESCRMLREEMLVLFWAIYTFHATLSPFTMIKYNHGLEQLEAHADKVQNLELELDFTTLGCAGQAHAVQLHPPTASLKRVLENQVSLLLGRGKNPMEYLHIKCRRIAGNRPETNQAYCPDTATMALEPLFLLRPNLCRLRLTGFPLAYTLQTITKVFGDIVKEKIAPAVMISLVWPTNTEGLYSTEKDLEDQRKLIRGYFGRVLSEADLMEEDMRLQIAEGIVEQGKRDVRQRAYNAMAKEMNEAKRVEKARRDEQFRQLNADRLIREHQQAKRAREGGLAKTERFEVAAGEVEPSLARGTREFHLDVASAATLPAREVPQYGPEMRAIISKESFNSAQERYPSFINPVVAAESHRSSLAQSHDNNNNGNNSNSSDNEPLDLPSIHELRAQASYDLAIATYFRELESVRTEEASSERVAHDERFEDIEEHESIDDAADIEDDRSEYNQGSDYDQSSVYSQNIDDQASGYEQHDEFEQQGNYEQSDPSFMSTNRDEQPDFDDTYQEEVRSEQIEETPSERFDPESTNLHFSDERVEHNDSASGEEASESQEYMADQSAGSAYLDSSSYPEYGPQNRFSFVPTPESAYPPPGQRTLRKSKSRTFIKKKVSQIFLKKSSSSSFLKKATNYFKRN